MNLCNVVLSTEPRGGKGGVATVIPMYLEALGKLGRTDFIPTHNGRGLWGKFGPWIFSFFRSVGTIVRERRSKIVFHLHPGSGFCIIRMLILAMFLRGITRQHVVVYLHTPYLETYLGDGYWRLIVGGLVRYSSRVVVLTSYARDMLKKYDMDKKARVVPNPFRIDPAMKQRHAVRSDEVVILIMGRLVPGKGFIETVRSIAHLPHKFRLVIAGDGELKKRLLEEIATLEIGNRVKMEGWVSGAEKDDLFERAAVFCLPSRVDSFGMSFVEAQCYDLPIVAFKHPPVMEVIAPGHGVFVETLDAEIIARAIEHANDLNQIISRGSGRAWVRKSFDIDRIGHLLDNVCMEILMPVVDGDIA